MADFDFTFQPSIDRKQIQELATPRFPANSENVIFLGPPGVGVRMDGLCDHHRELPIPCVTHRGRELRSRCR